MSLCHLNYDIWSEVLVSLGRDLAFSNNHKEIRECRATILHVALTSKVLRDLALSTLWRSMDSLEPIVHVVNSFASAEEGVFLYHQTFITKSHWVLREPLKRDIVAFRARDYLRRIRTFRIDGYSEKETALWAILSRFLQSCRSLLPNLQFLVVNFSSNEKTFCDSLMSLLPTSLELLEISEDEGSVSSYEPVLVFYQILIFYRVRLKGITHRGASSPELLSTLSHFKILESLRIEYRNKVTKSEKTTTILGLLEGFPSLTNLCVDLGTISFPTSLLSTPIDQCSIRSLELHATIEELMPFLCTGPRWLCLESLHLYIHSTVGLPWEVVLKKLRSTLPRLEVLGIDIVDATEGPGLRVRDLEAFSTRCMTRLYLNNVPHQFTDETWLR